MKNIRTLTVTSAVLAPASAFWLAVVLFAPLAQSAIDRRTELLNQALQATPMSARGSRLYAEHCASCHGPGGLGDAAHVVPVLAGQRELYLLKQLIDFAELERETPEMHRLMALKPLGSPQSWRDLAAHLSGLKPNDRPQTGDGERLSLGRRVYEKVCAECHGKAGEGDAGGSIPALRGQHYSYLLLQLRGFAVGHRLDIDLSVLEYISRLSFAELEGVADHVSRLPVDDLSQKIVLCVPNQPIGNQ